MKNSTNHNHQNNRKATHKLFGSPSQINAYNFGNTQSVMFYGKHAGEVVMNSPGKNGSKHDPHKATGPHMAPAMAPKIGPSPGYVQELYQKYAPPGHGNVVNTIG